MTRGVILLLAIGFVLGQIARIQVGNVAITFLDIGVGLSFLLWIGEKFVKREKPFKRTLPVTLV
ncbi:MAG TPA: hypothetical protein VG935_03300, partial [Patescibacteria group bacterium]|nr:hypothetical protein [Patescibacteria group bacterium]